MPSPQAVERPKSYTQSDVQSLADATREQTKVFQETFGPAAKAIVELNEAQKKFCGWVTTWKPYGIGFGVYLVSQYFPNVGAWLERLAAGGISVPS